MCLMWSIFDSAKLHSTLWSHMRVKVGTGLTVRIQAHLISVLNKILALLEYPGVLQYAHALALLLRMIRTILHS
jgi:hypothetical protein